MAKDAKPQHEAKDWSKFREENLQEQAAHDEASEAPLDAPESLLQHPSYTMLEEKLTEAEQLAHENWEKSVRATAELENVRRRAERDIANAHRFGVEKLVQSLLPVMDSLEQAQQLAMQSEDVAMVEGLSLTLKLMLDALQKVGVEQLDPMGQIFNPEYHEAMSIQVAPGAKPNEVIAVFQKGFSLHERVIRPARVIVAKSE